MVQDLISSKGDSDNRRSVVMRLIKEHDILPYCFRRAAEFVVEAKAGLHGLPESIHLDVLNSLADFILERRT